MKVRGPLVTLGAVAVLGAGLWVANVSQQNDPAPPTTPAAAATASAVPPAPSTPAPPAADPFPAKADYVGEIPIKTGIITLEITVDGSRAVAYACDGNTLEVWLSGSAEGGVVKLASKDKTSTLDGRHVGKTVVGSLRVGEKSWEFTTFAVEAPAGLYVSTDGSARNSWIVGADGTVTGVQRRADGSTAPAPSDIPDGATRVSGALDVA
ncbi:MAG: hypothetical protein K0R33_1599 [Mycobacterium sp.]|jgi:hypothetical protein|nr:hypothetical protein [Mycobacterium sp.]